MDAAQREHYRGFFKEYGERINIAIDGAFGIYQKYDPDHTKDHTKGVKCQIVRSHMVAGIKGIFPQGGPITWVERGELFRLNIGHDINLQFKKMNNAKEVSQTLTKQARAYRNQVKTSLFPPGLNFFVGYVPNEFFTAIQDIYVTCPQDFKIEFALSLREATPSAEIIPMEFKGQPTPSLDGVVKWKQSEKEERGNDGIKDQA
jgi:hypothetical protein